MKSFYYYLLLLLCLSSVRLTAQTYDTLALKVGEVYNFEVGDEFHYRSLHETESSWHNDYLTSVILAKSYSSNADTVFYTRLNTNYITNQCGALVEIDTSYQFFTDLGNYIITVTDTTVTDSIGGYDDVTAVGYSADSTLYNGRRVNSVQFSHLYFDSGSGGGTSYIEGCGTLSNSWDADNTWFTHNEVYLVYFKKGEESWGQPIVVPTIAIPVTPETSMTMREAFDFDIGDEFQFVRTTTGVGPFEHYFIKRVVTGKLPNISDNTIWYSYTDSIHYQPTTGEPNDYILQQNQTVSHLDTLIFDYYYHNNECASMNEGICQLLTNSVTLITNPMYFWQKLNFIKGCGMYSELHSSSGSTEDLVYYHKVNGNSCGEELPYFTGIGSPESHPEANLVTYPNPTDNFLQVLLPNSPNRQNATLQLIDLQGRVLKSANLSNSPNNPLVTLSTNELPNGMYVLTYTVSGVVQSRAKVVVNHATN